LYGGIASTRTREAMKVQRAALKLFSNASYPGDHSSSVTHVAEDIIRSNRGMREMMERQIAEMDETVTNGAYENFCVTAP
jgi:hypothetical protein